MRESYRSSFLLAVIIFLLIGCVWNSALRKIRTSWSIKQRLFDAHAKACECLILGSSHMHNGVDASTVFSNGFNLAAASQSLILDSQLLMHNKSKLPKLKVVVLEMFWLSLLYKTTSAEAWRDSFYWQWQKVSERSPWERVANLSYWSLLPTLGRDQLAEKGRFGKAVFLPNIVVGAGAIKDDGSANHVGPVSQFKNTAIERFEIHNALKDQSAQSEILNSLQAVLALCQNQKIRVLLVAPPLHGSYYSLIDPKIEKSQSEILNKLCQQYGCVFVDCTKLFGWDDSYFRDSDHLNGKGAQAFSQYLHNVVSDMEKAQRQ